MSCCDCCFFFFKQKTAYEMRISDWSSDVCSSDLMNGTSDIAETAIQLVAGTSVRFIVTTNLYSSATGSIQNEAKVRSEVEDSDTSNNVDKIGRASCRERVCQYV